MCLYSVCFVRTPAAIPSLYVLTLYTRSLIPKKWFIGIQNELLYGSSSGELNANCCTGVVVVLFCSRAAWIHSRAKHFVAYRSVWGKWSGACVQAERRLHSLFPPTLTNHIFKKSMRPSSQSDSADSHLADHSGQHICRSCLTKMNIYLPPFILLIVETSRGCSSSLLCFRYLWQL